MPLRIGDQDLRAVAAPAIRSVDGARAISGEMTVSSSVGTFAPMEQTCETYQQMTTKPPALAKGVAELPDEAYMSATFHGMREAVMRKCGEMPTGCFRCERETNRPYAGALWIRHDGTRHYIAFTDASGNSTEYRIYYCPFCGKKL